jgi:hypothetical protein
MPRCWNSKDSIITSTRFDSPNFRCNRTRLRALIRFVAIVLIGIKVSLPTTALFAETPLPVPDHIVIVIEENHSLTQVMDSEAIPFLQELTAAGALLTNVHAITHPSLPNYIALFAGSTEGVIANVCPLVLKGPNLRSALAQVGRSFVGYAEDLPTVGAQDCIVGSYVRKHNPWVNWQTSPFHQVPPAENRPFSDFPEDFNLLPTLSFVIPNQQNDMHDGLYPDRIQRGDEWLRSHLGGYVQWAHTHNSLFIVTWDEDDERSDNHIPMIMVGPMVRPGRYDERIDHYRLVRTITDMYGAPPIGLSPSSDPITSIWKSPLPAP